MSFPLFDTKVFAVSTLIFLSFLPVEAQSDSIYRLPIGTRITVTMDNEINSESASVNDTFTVTVAEPVVRGGVEVLLKGSTFEGRVTDVSDAGPGTNGMLTVEFEKLQLATGQTRRIEGVLIADIKPRSKSLFSVLSILGGSAAGSVLGALSGSQKGALIGAGIGAGAGTGVALLRKGSDVRIKTGEKFQIELKREVVLPALDY